MTASTQPTIPVLRHVLHASELSPESEFAFAHALRLAVAAQARFDVVHVDRRALVMGSEEFPDVREILVRWGLLPPDHATAAKLLEGFEVKKIAAYGTEPVAPLLAYLEESLPDLAVLATHQREGLARWLHKEIAQKVVRRNPTSTLFLPVGVPGFVSPSTGEVSLRRVLLPVDWNPSPQSAVDMAVALASTLACLDLELTLLWVGGPEGQFPNVERTENPGWSWHERLGSGEVVEAILAAADELDADLIAMATQGHDGFLDALRGSTTERVLSRAKCPVLSVPGYRV